MVPDLLFSQDDADSIYNELAGLSVSLDPDPLAFGPKRLNNKVADVRRMLDRCERLFLDVSQRMHRTRRAHRIAETELDLAKKDLYANDPVTRSGRSVADREAIATGKLEKQVRAVRDLDTSVLDLDAVITVVKAKRTDLKDTEGRLRDQIRLCQEEIGLGSRWGSRVPDANDLPDRPTGVNVESLDDIETLIGRVDGEIQLGLGEGTWSNPEVPIHEVQVPPEFATEDPVVSQDDGVFVGMSPGEDDVPLIADALPSTVTTEDAESFLDSVPLDISKSEKPGPKPLVIDESLIEDLLGGFENLG